MYDPCYVRTYDSADLSPFIAAAGIVRKESIIEAVKKTFGENKASLIAINEQAYDEGVKLYKEI